MLTNMAACLVVDQHCPCADMTWWNLKNKLFKLCLGNTKMFTSQKIGRMVFIYFHFDKILTHANAIDRMHVNAREKWTPHNFLACTFFSFQQGCSTNDNTWNKASIVKNITKTSYDVMHVGQGMSNEVSYRPPDMIDHRTLDDKLFKSMIRSLFIWYEPHEKSIPNILNGCCAWRWSDSATQGGVNTGSTSPW